MIYVVLGMHKSGTTLVAELLHRSGIDMGDFDGTRSYDEGNQYERVATQRLNRQLLDGVLRPILSDRIQRRLRPRTTHDGRPINRESLAAVSSRPIEASEPLLADMRSVIEAHQRRHPDWGFKDPRTCLTYPVWMGELPPHRVIAIYRDPREVLAREARRRFALLRPLRLRRVLRNWIDYNRGILRALDRTAAPFLVVRYDRLMEDPAALARLSDFVGRALVDARRRELRRSSGEEAAGGAAARAALAGFWSESDEVLARLDRLAGER
jgi:hypothetical protein